MADTVVLTSAGLNSAVTAARAAQSGIVHLLHADFGQRPVGVQRGAGKALAAAIGAGFTSIELPHVSQIATLRKPASSPAEVSVGEPTARTLTDVSQVPGLMAVILSAAVQVAHRLGAGVVQSGVSELADELETESAPGQGSPDHRREFHYLFNVLLEQLQKKKSPIRLETPLIDLAREDIIKLGMRYNTPFDLTYSCQEGQHLPCGCCPSCTARAKAFTVAGLTDPAAAPTT